jgi:hypothetical protein
MTEISVKLICDMSDIEAKMGRINASMQRSFSPVTIGKTYARAAKQMEDAGKKVAYTMTRGFEIARRSWRSQKFGGLIAEGEKRAKEQKPEGGELGIAAMLQGLVGALTLDTMGTIVLAAALLQIFSKLYEGIMWGFSGLMKAVNILGKVIGAIIRPFADLLIPVVILLARLLMPVAKILRLILMPFYKLINMINQGIYKLIASLVGSAMSMVAENPLGAILFILNPVLAMMIDQFIKTIPYIRQAFEWVAQMIVSFLTFNLSDLTANIEKWFGPLAGGVINAFVKAIYFCMSAVMGFAAQLVGKDTFNQIFGAGQFDKISEMNTGFATGKDIAATLQGLYTAITSLTAMILTNPLGTMVNLITVVIMAFLDALQFITETILKIALQTIGGDMVSAILRFAKGLVDAVIKILPAIANGFNLLIKSLVGFSVGLWRVLGAVMTELSKLPGMGGLLWFAGMAEQKAKGIEAMGANIPELNFAYIVQPLTTLSAKLNDMAAAAQANDLNAMLKPVRDAFDSARGNIAKLAIDIDTNFISANTPVENLRKQMDAIGLMFSHWNDKMMGFDPVTYFQQRLEASANALAEANTPAKQVGGDIPGTGLYYLHRGETVTPASTPARGGGGNTNITINVSGAGMDTKALVRELSKELQKQLGVRSTYGTGF